ncbi:serine protease [Paenibacillus sambharensis]|uniref:Serine protease n=1 Tax=Paenibacillus sambharensis TaxID=1803190 RepID=A0A2W1LEX1_9BACL|nr:trypsin-like peptidase domain-containing protein [Paenibacillus sambharensis]PZD96590.1 serine protease [Paenibacillus sambharensis]
MSLFDDDFYSTRVSRRVRSRKDEWGIPAKRSWGAVRIAFVSSFVSAMAAVVMFGFIYGYDSGSPAGGTQTGAAPIQTADPFERTIQAAAVVRPAVVSIINEQLLPQGEGLWSSEDETEEELDSGEEAELQQASLGSGVIFKKTGGNAYIITNYHVVEGAHTLKAMLVNGEVREAKVVGMDQITDLAVLEIDGKGIDTVAAIGDSMKLRDGETVIAIGNPLGLGDSLTMGIVSKSKRTIPVSLNQDGNYDWEQEVIQIDASINQGNSGGALVNLSGEVVGINSMKVADYGVEGIGFAIPMNSALPVVDSLMEHGKVLRPYLGVYTLDLEQYLSQQPGAAWTDEEDAEGEKLPSAGDELNLPKDVTEGVIVLESLGPAKEAGLAFNDVIVKLDRQAIGSTMELRKYLYNKKEIGDTIDVTFYRDGKLKTTTFKLGEKDNEEE